MVYHFTLQKRKKERKKEREKEREKGKKEYSTN
jgi:hypothetical protein